MPSTAITTMPVSSSSITPPLTSLNEGLYTTPIVTSDSSSQYCSSSEVSLLNCNTTSPTATTTSSNDTNSNCSLSPNSSNSSITSDKKSTPSIGVNLRVTGQCSQGGRKYMEDYFSVAYQQSENAKDLEYAFIGIYDGHGGAEAATFAKEHLMMEIINQRLFWSDSDHDVLRAIREGYIATHYAMWREQDKWPKTANGLPSTAGTTATIAFIRREKIYIGHVGDSGIVLGYQNENENFWRAKQLTVDHKPESLEERTRIMKSGGKVVVKSGVPRVVWNRPRNASHRGPIKHKTPVDEIPFLAVARSLGDLWSYNSERNEFVVSPDPDVKVIPIDPKTFRCLIFGTDGLWNVVTPQEAVNTVREKEVINERLQAHRGDCPNEGQQWTNPSKSLVDQALSMWSSKKMRADNTSVVTVILYPPGQGGHNATNQIHKDVGSAITTPPAFIQPASYGLEYTQVQAEIPTYDDATTYKEMAMKYLPPEEYRNFDYYADDSDHGEDTDESDSEETAETRTKSLMQNGVVTHNNYHLQQTNAWNWQQHSNQVNTHHPHHVSEEEPGYVEDGEEEDDDEIDEDEDDEEEEEEDEVANTVNNATSSHSVESETREVCVIDYQNYLQIGSEEANSGAASYINTFAESYNTLLSTAQVIEDSVPSTTVASLITPTNSNSNSSSNSSNCQSVSPPNMHAIIEEQQLYQQQCMSGEDGYSLTKLETRREQQSCKSQSSAVDTFKIFHHTNGDQQHSRPDMQNMAVYSTSSTTTATTTESYYEHSHLHPTAEYMPQKPLELHSLLQQEREEEQQVAYERLQQQQQLQNINSYACLQAIRHNDDASPSTSASVYVANQQQQEPITLPTIMEEKAMDVVMNSTDDLIEEVDDSVTITVEPCVQINEISSSSSTMEDIIEEEAEVVEAMVDEECVETTCSKTPAVIETIEKIEILQEDDSMYDVCRRRRLSNQVAEEEKAPLKVASPEKRQCLSVSKTNTSCLNTTSTPVAANKNGLRTGRAFAYGSSNVQNENVERISSRGRSKHAFFNSHNQRRSLSMTPATSSSSKTSSSLLMTPPTAASTPIMRQLRSNSSNTPIDYGKRTLRTRNSLTKDMKAKSTMVQSALKLPHNTRKFLQRNGAGALIVSNAVLIQDQHLTPTQRRSLNGNGSTCSGTVNRSIKTRNNSTMSPMPPAQQTPHHLNLRSRQNLVTPTSAVTAAIPNIIHLNNNSSIDSLVGSPPPPISASTPVIKRASSSLSDRRNNLRSIHTRSSSRIGPAVQATNFSKTTRSQSTGTSLAAPPPSPKMINAAAAVAAATRARSLISQQRAAQANGTQSVVSAVFGKRVNLRSNGVLTSSSSPAAGTTTTGTPSVAVLATPPPPSTHQTLRGRIVKKLKR
ncbi:serine-rich adhesin for platelets [Musca vetustissima]|uniref:serine-rich adhesin for platelets n=1 Tax=Musca vetustissima TaxID=27455 RepID=UPI002AB66F4F|nr:serine-rich adhesin for platelets [Musca vetustissima]